MEDKFLLDKDGFPITKERIEEVFKKLSKEEEPWFQKQEWVEDGQICHSWKVKTGRGYIHTNDAGMEQINQTIKQELLNWKDGKESNNR